MPGCGLRAPCAHNVAVAGWQSAVAGKPLVRRKTKEGLTGSSYRELASFRAKGSIASPIRWSVGRIPAVNDQLGSGHV